ncbi:hypothetical protein NKG05_25775 [Oerskovia sp. M15]
MGAVVDAASFDGAPVDGTASFDSARAIFRALRCPDGPQRMIDDSRFALDAEPVWSPWRDTALALHGDALRLVGDEESAARHLRLAVQAATDLGRADIAVFAAAHLADLDMDHDRWSDADVRVRHVLGLIDDHRMDDHPVSALGFATAARHVQHSGDHARTHDLLTRGMRARTSCTFAFPTLAVRARLQLARASRRRPTSRRSGTSCARSTTCCSVAQPSDSSPTTSPSCTRRSTPPSAGTLPAARPRRSRPRSCASCRTCRPT